MSNNVTPRANRTIEAVVGLVWQISLACWVFYLAHRGDWNWAWLWLGVLAMGYLADIMLYIRKIAERLS